MIYRYATKIAATLIALITTAAYAVDIKVVSSGGFAQTYEELAPIFAMQTDNRLYFTRSFSSGASNNSIPMRLDRGEDIDVVIMTGSPLDELMDKGKLLPGSKVQLASSLIACAVKHGEPRLDISTATKLKSVLLNAKSMAYSNGASGNYIKNDLMSALGIKEQMASKLKLTPAKPVGDVIASGEVQMGCQQLSELTAVKGVDIIGLLPQELQLITPFYGAVTTTSKVPNQARDLLIFLKSPANNHLYEKNGLTPAN